MGTDSRKAAGAAGGAEATKQRILEAAQHLFATRGYAETGVRDICAMAEVNQALVGRYFGSKLGLFEAALEASFDVDVFIGSDRADFGRRLAETFGSAPPEAAHAVAALIYAAGDSEARQAALRVLKRCIITPLKKWLGSHAAEERTAQVLAVVTGFFVYRLMLPLKPFQGGVAPATRAWLASTLQEIVDRAG